MRAARTSRLDALRAVLVRLPCANDICPAALSGHGCEGTTGCEQCLSEACARVEARLAADAEGRAWLDARAAAVVTHRLELDPTR